MDFARPARNIQHLGRRGDAGEPATQGRHQGAALGDRRVEMRRAGCRVELVQVIGLHPCGEHGAEQAFQRLGTVIHTAQQDGLAGQGNAAFADVAQDVAHVRAEFAGVVDVQDDEERFVGLQRVQMRGSGRVLLGEAISGLYAAEFIHRRLLEPIGNIPPAEAEERVNDRLNNVTIAARSDATSLRQTWRGSMPCWSLFQKAEYACHLQI